MINLISCMDNNNVIGKDNEMPWHLPKDLAHFKSVTEGNVVVMGRKTYESIGNFLPNRINIILTNNMEYDVGPKARKLQAYLCNSIEDILEIAETREVFIIGGSTVYEQFLPHADKLYITRVNAEFEGDTYFPKVDHSKWKPIEESIKKEDDNGFELFFVTYERAE